MKKPKNPSKPDYYCAAAIRGDTSFVKYANLIPEIVREYGEPRTERSETFNPLDQYLDDAVAMEKKVYERDMQWLRQSRAVIAEISGGSCGTGSEITKAAYIMRKPVMCLYNESSFPSLMIKQDPSKYYIIQKYGPADFRAYLSCFMEIVSQTIDIDEVRPLYLTVSKKIKEGLVDADKIRQCVASLLKTSQRVGRTIDFLNLKEFTCFMYRNVVLQIRWGQLKSQRIGSTFISGDKPRIVRVLAESAFDNVLSQALTKEANGPEIKKHEDVDQYASIHLTHIFHQLRKDRLKYSRWAFTKNLRAYRRVGLLLSGGEIRYSSSRFRDQVGITQTLDDRRELISFGSRIQKMNPICRVTKHIYHLSTFLDKLGQETLVEFLSKINRAEHYASLAELRIGESNIDLVSPNDILEFPWGTALVDDLTKRCKRIWRRHYSSFVGTEPTRNLSRTNESPVKEGDIKATA
jgi:hypothetical protein